MSIAAALPINQLTEDQAVEELARILDLAPDEADQLAFVHWKQEFSRRAQQLEQHIVHLQKVAGADVLPGPEAETQDAPPHHLQPEPPPSPAATKEKPVSLRKTDDEKLASTLAYYQGLLARVKVCPGERTLRNDCQKAACAVRAAARKAHHPEPVLEPLPPIPDPRPKGGTHSQEDELPPVPVAPTSALREIRKAFWALLRDMEDMTYPERAALSYDLVFIQHQAAHALDLIEETEIPEAG